jgi:hypothetical protein
MDVVWEALCAASRHHPRPRPRWSDSTVLQVYRKTQGRCWHCQEPLPPDDARGHRRWHVDHHPVRYADIEDQLCCGVTDPLDPGNLVPSCAPCNTNHVHESGQACCRCRRRYVARTIRAGVVVVLLTAAAATARLF